MTAFVDCHGLVNDNLAHLPSFSAPNAGRPTPAEGMDGEGASPRLTGLRLLEDKLCDAKALLWRVGRRAGGSEQEQVEEEKEEEARQGNRW